MATDFNSMFGVITPEQAQQVAMAQAQERNLKLAQLPLNQQGIAMMGNAGAGIGAGLGRMFGGQTSMEAEQAVMKDVFNKAAAQSSDPVERLNIAAASFDSIDPAKAQALRDKAMEMQKSAGEAALKQEQAAAAKDKAAKEQRLRQEIEALGPNPSDEELMGVYKRFGSPDMQVKIMEGTKLRQDAIEARQAEAAARAAQRADEFKQRQEQALELARQRGADALELRRMMIQGQQQLAEMQIQARREQIQFAAELNRNKPLPEPVVSKYLDYEKETSVAKRQGDRAADLINKIEKGVAQYGVVKNSLGAVRTLFGNSSESDLVRADIESYVTESVNAILNLAKGPQTDKDADRARVQIMSGLSKNDAKAVKEGLKRLKKVYDDVFTDSDKAAKSMAKYYPALNAGKEDSAAPPPADEGKTGSNRPPLDSFKK